MADPDSESTDPQNEGDEVPRFYSNSVAAHAGAFDVVLDFGFELGDASEPRSSVARVAMSWEHARAFTEMLGAMIDRYEQELGPLPNIEKARVRNDGGVSE